MKTYKVKFTTGTSAHDLKTYNVNIRSINISSALTKGIRIARDYDATVISVTEL